MINFKGVVSIGKVRKKIDAFDEIPKAIEEMLRNDDELEPEGNLHLTGFDLPGITVGDDVTLTVTGTVERMSKNTSSDGDNRLHITVAVRKLNKVK